MGVFYPSLVVDLGLRFDEALQVAETPENESRPTGGTTLGEGPLYQGQGVTISRAVVEKDGVSSQVDPETGNVLVPLVLPEGNLSQLCAVIPKTASVELPGVRQAGNFSLTFDFRDLPIDPRMVRACSVDIYLGAVAAGDFAAGIGGETQDDSITSPRRSILRTRSGGLRRDDLLVLTGVVDTWRVEHGDRRSIVKMDGRDIRGLFMDPKVPPEKAADIDVSRPIDEVVRAILALIPAELGFRVDVFPSGFDGPLPSPGDKEGLTRVRKGASGGGAKSSPPGGGGAGGDSISYWDLITRYCQLCGAIPYFVGNQLRIRPSRSIFDAAGASQTPFAGGRPRSVYTSGPGGEAWEELRVRRMVYGRDITNLSYERKYTGQNVPTVQCVSLDDSQRGAQKLLLAQWPPESSVAAKAKGESERLRIPVPGIRDKARLEAIARSLYEEIGRGEMGGACESKDLASVGGDNEDADLLRLRPADAVEFLVDPTYLSARTPYASTLTSMAAAPFSALVREINSRLVQSDAPEGDVNLARVIAASTVGGVVDQLRFFRVSCVRFDWDVSSGVKVAFDFQNYVVARHQADASKAEERGTSTAVHRKGANRKALSRAQWREVTWRFMYVDPTGQAVRVIGYLGEQSVFARTDSLAEVATALRASGADEKTIAQMLRSLDKEISGTVNTEASDAIHGSGSGTLAPEPGLVGGGRF